jgi:hypothetical protein
MPHDPHPLNWFWIAVAAGAPLALALLFAWLFWIADQTTIGNLVGTAIVCVAAIAAIGREYAELQRFALHCVGAGVPCRVDPGPFVRFAIYGCIAMGQIAGVFMTSVWFEERRQRRLRSKEWR